MAADRRGGGGARATIVFLVVAAVLAGLLYGADSYVHARVEREAASSLQSRLGTPTPPSVDIAGRPFLTQVVGRTIGTTHVVADDLGADGSTTLPVRHVDMTLTGIRTQDWWRTMTADHAEGTALVDYAALQARAGVPLTYAGGGRFRVESTQSVYGLSVHTVVTGGLALDVPAQTVSLSDPTIDVAGVSLPEVAAQALIRAVVKPIPLDGVPLGLRVTAIEARDDGLHVTVAGDDVPLPR